ncbi:hypothetical protein pdam_00009718 [Pocillopora damicornis]|uniref:Uncharacterized protein n=1 Tax=Pocillopora damicornis TaxID=46731 RepID=A0A3M6TPL9_POCDA|nr:hypothetical protein pdam_00009718 [Pocillopora damicornis]
MLKKIPNFSALLNFEFTPGGLCMWKALIFGAEATCLSEENRFSQSQHERWIRRPLTMRELMMSVAPSNVKGIP